MWVYYARQPAAPVLPVLRLMSPEPDPAVADMVAGRIVLIGTSAIGLRDLVSTPLASGLPGVLVHAEIIDQIVGGTFLSRPDWAVGAEVVAAVCSGAAGAGLAAVAALVLQRAGRGRRGGRRHCRRLARLRLVQAAAVADPARAMHADRLRRRLRRAAAAQRKRAPLYPQRLQPLSGALDGAAARRQSAEPQSRRRESRAHHAVLRHSRLHQPVGRAWTARTDRAPQQLPDADDRRADGQRRHHRQIYGRCHHGVLERAASERRPPAPGLPQRAADAGGAGSAEPRPAAPDLRSASASTPASAASAISGRGSASTIRRSATRSTSPRGSRA